VRVEYPDPEPSGLATMIGTLIEQNLERDPARLRLLRPSVAAIEAPDAGVAVTVRTSPGRVVVVNGADPDAHVGVTADSSTLLQLTGAPLRFGLPDALDPRGRAVLRDVLTRRVRIRGLASHPRRLARLTMLLSVS
jgi:hypothetical protein